MENKSELEELLAMEAKAQAEVKDLAEGNAVSLKAANEEIIKLGEEVSKLKEVKMEAKNEKSFGVKLKEAGFGLNSGELNLKAVLDYSSLTQDGQLDQVDTSISYLPSQAPKLINLFPRITMVGETYSYLDQTARVRNAQGVAKCSTGGTFTSEETIIAKRVNDVLIKDLVDICLDYADDYAFVEESARKLIEGNLVQKIEAELVSGSNSASSLNSLAEVSSEFDAANSDAPVGATIAQAQYVDLVLAMATQIEVLGEDAAFVPNVVVANKLDVFKYILSAKTTEGAYLDPRVSNVGGQLYVGGLLVVTSPSVVANSAYVFDSSKGAILDRRSATLQMSTENGTNFADGFGTLKGTQRLQFLVKDAEANAFMKCSDVATAITAITAA